MKISQAGILGLVLLVILSGTGCNFFARKNVVDGAEAFKNRKFDEAESLFRLAVSRAPADSVEGKTAQLFLARTLHSQYAANRDNTKKAEEAIEAYQKVLAVSPNDNSSFKAVASLYENLDKKDEWRKWVTDRSENTSIPPEQRAEAYTSLASKENSCANDITEDPKVKKTEKEGDKSVFKFSKPEDPAELERLRGCIQRGTELINKALALETDQVKNAKSINYKPMSDKDLAATLNALKPFESARSYSTSLLVQSARLAEMDGKAAEKDQFKKEADAARERFKEIADVTKALKDEQEARAKAKEEAAGNVSTSSK
jgi:tetratricopeptide (TPR) repeat protein